jgi:chromosome segregation ATPase
MLKMNLDECRTHKTNLSTKLNKLIPEHTAIEIEMSKIIDSKTAIQQELIAAKNELSLSGKNKVTYIKETTELKKKILIIENRNSDLQLQLNQLRSLKVKLESMIEEINMNSIKEINLLKEHIKEYQNKLNMNTDKCNDIQNKYNALKNENTSIRISLKDVEMSNKDYLNQLNMNKMKINNLNTANDDLLKSKNNLLLEKEKEISKHIIDHSNEKLMNEKKRQHILDELGKKFIILKFLCSFILKEISKILSSSRFLPSHDLNRKNKN